MSARCFDGLCAAILLLCVSATQARATWHEQVATDKDSGVAIDISSPFEHSPPGGYLPLWVTIRNDSGAPRTWSIFCNGSARYGNDGSREISTGSLRVESGQTARVPVLMALDPSSTSFYQSGSVRIDGYAIPQNSTTDVPGINARGKGNRTPVVGMSEGLATPIWTSLTKRYTDDGHDLMGTPVDLGLLGGDWRALVGLDALWINDADFATLDASRRVAIHNWVAQGGRLFVCAQGADPSLRAGLGLSEAGDAADLGLGRVELLPWDGKPLPLDKLADKIDLIHSQRADAADSAADWPMVGDVGRIPLNAPFLIAFIVLFAVVVGPLNLFWFASAVRRHRLFWTTPLLSVAASLLLAGFIILEDGFGGHGERVMLCLLLPGEKNAVVTQEQVARTGVLFSRQFQTSEEVVVTARSTGFGSDRRSREQNGRTYTGDWFASRSVQAHRMEAVVPSRAEIQLLNADAARDGAPPVVTSSVPAAIKAIYYRDPNGKQWRGENLRTGERVSLLADTTDAASGLSVGGSAGLNAEIRTLGERSGGFVAVAPDGPFFDTLPSIRWNKQEAVFAGLVSIAH